MLTVNVDWWTKKNKVLSFPHFESSIQKQVEIMTWRSTESSTKHKTQSISTGTAARLQHFTALSTKSSLRAVRVSASWVQTAGCEWVGECFFWYGPTQVVPDQGPLNGCVCVCVCVWVQTAEVMKQKLWQCRWCRRGRWDSSGAAVNSQHSRQSVRMAGTPCSRRRPCTPCTSSPHATSHSPSSSQPSAPNLDTQLPPMTINCNFAALLTSCNCKFIHKL